MSTAVNVNPSPKEKFLTIAKESMTRHVEMVSSDEFAFATDIALLEYQRKLANSVANDLGSAASLHLRMLGAQEFLGVLFSLHVAPTNGAVKVAETNLTTNQPRK